MDRLPYEFRESVAAYWKCCEAICNRCSRFKSVPDCDWTMKSKKDQITVVISYDKGEWKHSFFKLRSSEEERVSLEELLGHPNLKHLMLRVITVNRKESSRFFWSREATERGAMERVMRLVVFLANESLFYVKSLSAESFSSGDGAILLKFLSKMSFSDIALEPSLPVFNRILENQFSRKTSTEITVSAFPQNEAFFKEHLANGNIKRFHCMHDFEFPVAVMEGIINSFLENPGNYQEDRFQINAKFERKALEFVIQKAKDGECEKESHGVYRFQVRNAETAKSLQVQLSCKDVSIR